MADDGPSAGHWQIFPLVIPTDIAVGSLGASPSGSMVHAVANRLTVDCGRVATRPQSDCAGGRKARGGQCSIGLRQYEGRRYARRAGWRS